MFDRLAPVLVGGIVLLTGLTACGDADPPAPDGGGSETIEGKIEQPVETDQVSITLEETDGAETGSVVLGDVALMVVNVDLKALQDTGVRIDSIALDASDDVVSVNDDECTGAEIVAGSPCEVWLEVTPESIGTYTVTFVVTLESGGDPVEQTFEIEVVEPEDGENTKAPGSTEDPATPDESDHPADDGDIVE